jgi:uncharacterized RDD family membrane protein YckC
MVRVATPVPEPAPSPTPTAIPLIQTGVRYGGFWRRFLAAVIDSVLLTILGGLVNLAMGVSIIAPDYTESRTWGAFCLNLASGWIYCAWFESSRFQGTPGYQTIGLVVTDLHGLRISFLRASGRHFGQIVSALLLLIGYLMIAFTEKKQGLHDLMAGCLVILRPAEAA